MEMAFKIVFGVAIIMFCALIVGIFLLVIKILFLFDPEVTILGVKMIPAASSLQSF